MVFVNKHNVCSIIRVFQNLFCQTYVHHLIHVDNTPPTTDSVVTIETTTAATPSVITVVLDITIEEFEEIEELIVSQLEKEVRNHGYLLMEIKRIAFGKTR